MLSVDRKLCHTPLGKRRVVGELCHRGKLGGKLASTRVPGDDKLELRLKEEVIDAGCSVGACRLSIQGEVVAAEVGEVAAGINARLGQDALEVEWVTDFLHTSIYLRAIKVAAVFDADKVSFCGLYCFRARALFTGARTGVVIAIAACIEAVEQPAAVVHFCGRVWFSRVRNVRIITGVGRVSWAGNIGWVIRIGGVSRRRHGAFFGLLVPTAWRRQTGREEGDEQYTLREGVSHYFFSFVVHPLGQG